MKTKASASKNAAEEDEVEPKKIRSSRSNRRQGHHNRSSFDSESPPHKRSKKHSKRITNKKSKRSKISSSSSRRHCRSHSPSRSLSSSSSPSSITRHSYSTCSSSASERSVSPPPRSRSRDARKKKGRGRDRERDCKRRKARRSATSSSTSASSGSSRSRSRSKSKHRKRKTVAGTTRHKIEIDYNNRHDSQSEKHMAEDDDTDENKLSIAKKREHDIDSYKKNLESGSPPPKNANETQEMAPAGGGNSDAEDLELILRQKALENFRKFRAAAVVAGKTGTNGATGKEALIDDPQSAGTEIAGARSSAVTHFQKQGSSLVMKNPARSPRSKDYGNGTSHSWKQEGSAGMSSGAASPGILEDGDTGGATQQKGRTEEATRSNCQFRSPQDGRNSHSVMQRLGSTPGSCGSVNQRLGSSAGVSHVNGTPRVRSVVSIPAREGLDGSTYTTPPRPSENSAPVESTSDVGRPLTDINKAERANGDDRKTSEASASNSSILPPAEGKSQARPEDKDGAQFQKKTFSRMHDGETVEVSYKVYIPKKAPALARRKLQR
ncbi:hypothetical protein GQ55_2G005500 [Panicum hallii var. hallii]|uniref:Uncharacterized protein n=1 Tax=Panicum hallii var. hallii TaxID=1504633 RepID=A0A2T7EK36_9POAL|nr:hypothetical protein GQ55_2G005500 [Panicum hallii var. hallii]PUZ68191.1 hypothetical protein GQ55_2G005500 [Panicum hallii var. hallii]